MDALIIVTHFLGLWSHFNEPRPSKGLAQCLLNVRDTVSGPTIAVVSPSVLGQGIHGHSGSCISVGLKLPALAFQWEES